MDKYEVMLYPKAMQDIEDIYEYIAIEKLAPENAKSQYNIKEEIYSFLIITI